MDKLKYFIIKDIINNTVYEQTKKVGSQKYYEQYAQKETFEKNLEADLRLLNESSLFLIHKTILHKN